MATKTVKASQLTVGDKIYVSGKIEFSRITRKIEIGTPEFIEANMRKKAVGATLKEKSYTTLTITNPAFKPENPEAFKYENGTIVADPDKMTKLERYMYESMYTSKDGSWRLSNENTGNLPSVGEMDMDTKTITLVTPQGELAKGLDVLLVFSVFRAKSGQGVGLQAVLSRGPIKYYSHNDTTSALEGLGFAVKDERVAEPTDEAEAPAPAAPAPAQNTVNFDEPAQAVAPNPLNAVEGSDSLPW